MFRDFNDIFKEHLAKTQNKKLIRFWASEVITEGFFEKLKEVLYEESASKES